MDSRRVIVAPYDDLHVATTSIGEDSGLAAVAIAGIEARIDATHGTGQATQRGDRLLRGQRARGELIQFLLTGGEEDRGGQQDI